MRFSVITSFLLFITIAYSVTAQNFQPFRNQFKYQFSYISSSFDHSILPKIHGIQVDSAALINSDSIFYFNRLLESVSTLSFKDNFWGNSMVKKPGDEYLFLITNNTQNDTLIIKTQELLGTQWTFSLKNVLFTARYESYRQETVLSNQTDFVKTFIVENTSGFTDSIKISENFGLIYSFPFSDEFDPHHNNFNLTYIFNTALGENQLNYFEYFNYDAGDILIYSPAPPGPPTDPLNNDVYKVLSKTVSAHDDTIIYSFSKCHIDAINAGTYSTTQTHCELVVTACSVTGNFPYIDVLSFPPNKNTNQFYAYIPNQNRDSLTVTPAHVFEGFDTYTFQSGLGLKEFFYNGLPNDNNVTYKNTRYIKQANTDDDCGNLEITLSAKSSQPTNKNLVIAPNPFENSITLNTSNLNPGNCRIRIVSTLGIEVYTSETIISSSNQQLDISDLSALTAGIYFLSLENESKLYSQKIIKQ
jgi:hypothetical protein